MTLSSRSSRSTIGLHLFSSDSFWLRGNHEGPTPWGRAADGGLLNFLGTNGSSDGDGTKVEEKTSDKSGMNGSS